jgi:predicted TIM-barrel fold metal-dependent hydrolase
MATSYTTDPIGVIDVDSHYSPPPGFWEAHAPAAFTNRVPRIGEDAEGMPQWLVDGQPFDSIGFNMVRPDGTKAPGNMRALPFFEQMHAGSYDVKARLGWLDEHGIDRQIMYPNTGGFSSQMFFTKIADEELRNVCIRTYNDAAAALQNESGNRLVPLSQMPWWNIGEAERELSRTVTELGLTAGPTMFSAPEVHGLPALNHPQWSRFLSICEDLDVPLSFHIGPPGGGAQKPWVEPGADAATKLATGRGVHLAIYTTNSFLSNSWLISNLIFNGIPLRHPRLKIVSGESGISWLPFLLESMDFQWHENIEPEDKRDVWNHMTPGDVYRRNFTASFWFEKAALAQHIDFLGADTVMFETDFPHGTSLTDRMTDDIAATLATLTPEVRKKVLHDTAARVYNLR